MIEYIQEFEKSLSPEFCQNVIELFENEPNKHPGETQGGVKPEIKNVLEYNITLHNKNEKWLTIEKHLFEELQSKLLAYMKNLDNNYEDMYFKKNDLIMIDRVFMIARYEKNIGEFKYHNDAGCNCKYYRTRYLTYLWYLNDVIEGGETEFFGNYKIKPEVGKLVLFPACWSFPYCELMPISSNKYIITGWLSMYSSNKLVKRIQNIDMKEKMGILSESLPSFNTKNISDEAESSNNTESNKEKEKEKEEEEEENFRQSYGRVYYLS